MIYQEVAIATALLASGDDHLIVEKDGKLFSRNIQSENDEPIVTPVDNAHWLEMARVKWGLLRVLDGQGKPEPNIGEEFPYLVGKVINKEPVYVVKSLTANYDSLLGFSETLNANPEGCNQFLTPYSSLVALFNEFCPTGKKGGVDPTCSPNGKKKGVPGSQMDERTKKQLRDVGMTGTFPPADVPLSAIKVADLSQSKEQLKYVPLLKWKQTTKSGRTSPQNRYTQAFHDRNAAEKFSRVTELEPLLPKAKEHLKKIMTDTNRSTREREGAAIASVIAETGLRPTDSKESLKYGRYGVGSIQARHVKIKGNTIELNFLGKEGVRNKAVVTDPVNVKFIKDSIAGKGPKDFVFSEGNSNDAIKQLKTAMGRDDVLLKDLRTIKATQAGLEIVKKFKGPPPPFTGNEKKDAKVLAKAILEMSG